ncbi:MAG: hypothetical protein ACRDQF_04910 [Thermocrispum sp.]
MHELAVDPGGLPGRLGDDPQRAACPELDDRGLSDPSLVETSA